MEKIEKIEYDTDKSIEKITEFSLILFLFFQDNPKTHKKFVTFAKKVLKNLEKIKDKNPKKYDELINSFKRIADNYKTN